MLQKVQEYKWHITIGISVIVMLFLLYQNYSANKKINMLFRCVNELSCRIEDVASMDNTAPIIVQKSQPTQTKRLAPTSKSQESKKNTLPRQQQQQPNPKPIEPISPRVKVQTSQQPVVSETIIFQVAPPPQPSQAQTKHVSASTIEEIDSDSDSDVEENTAQDIDLDKALEAELNELNE